CEKSPTVTSWSTTAPWFTITALPSRAPGATTACAAMKQPGATSAWSDTLAWGCTTLARLPAASAATSFSRLAASPMATCTAVAAAAASTGGIRATPASSCPLQRAGSRSEPSTRCHLPARKAASATTRPWPPAPKTSRLVMGAETRSSIAVDLLQKFGPRRQAGQQSGDALARLAVAPEIVTRASRPAQSCAHRGLDGGSFHSDVAHIGIALAQALPVADIHHRRAEGRCLDDAGR